MQYSKIIGVSAPEIGWVPSPGFILRRAAIMSIVKKLKKGKVLEVGCGPGGLLYDLGRAGFQCTGVEISEKSRAISEKLLADFPNITVVGSTAGINHADFDYLFSFEVLEHIENDVGALKSWLEHLKQSGLILLSLPAQKSKWNVTDLMAGHYRRYNKKDVEKLLSSADLEIIKIETYGWPMSCFLERIRLWVRKYQLRKSNINVDELKIGDIELTKQSGVDRNTESRFFKFYANKYFGLPIWYLITRFQTLFYKTDLGISYIVLAKKKSI